MRAAVCIVSPGNLASNPRLLKEADALHEAGYAVTAVVCNYTEALRSYDDEIAARVPWKVIRVARDAGEGQIRLVAGAVARLMATAGRVPVALAARAYGGPVTALQRAASKVPADLYIAHYIPGLAAAALAARRHGAMLGFDAEDFHSGEAAGGAADKFRADMVRAVERALLPSCVHVTAAAPMIADAYAAHYGISPTTVLNVFPLLTAPAEPRRGGEQEPFKAYWFSQTIGLNRGLQSFIRAMARARTRINLDVRGSNRWRHGDRLMELARELGIADQIRLLPMAPPGDMVRLAGSYDIGLALEINDTKNHQICLSNKIFTYLLAGTPVLMSDTPAQRALATQLGAAARIVALADPDDMAAVLDGLARSPAARAEAAASAWRLGRVRYNWDVEKEMLLGSVSRVFQRGKVPP